MIWYLSAVCMLASVVYGADFCTDNDSRVFVHPSDCSRFITCSFGREIHGSCPPGLLFNSRTKICDFTHNVPDCAPVPDVPVDDVTYQTRHNDLVLTNQRDEFTDNRDAPYQAPPARPAPPPPPAPPAHVPAHQIREPHQTPKQSPPRAVGAGGGSEMVHSVHMDLPNPLQVNILPPAYGGAGDDYIENLVTDGDFIDCTQDGLFPLPDCSYYVQCASGMAFEKPCPPGTYFSFVTKTCGFDNGHCNYQPPERDDGDDGDERRYQPEIDEIRSYPEDPDVDFISEPAGGNSEELMSRVRDYVPEALRRSNRRVRDLRQKEREMARIVKSQPRSSFHGVSGFLGTTTLVKQMSEPASQQLLVLGMIQKKFSLNTVETEHVIEKLDSILRPSTTLLEPDMRQPRPTLNRCPYPKNSEDNMCDGAAAYRTLDGSCNNLGKPMWGKSFRGFSRFLRPDYYDAIQEPRRAVSGAALPSARAVSVSLFEEVDRPSHVHTLMMTIFGQFTDHDVTRTAVTKLSMGDKEEDMVEVKCGLSQCETTGVENEACLPIFIPRNDPDFHGQECLMFVRTQEALRDDCVVGPRDQMNQVTPTLDASMVYGSTKEEADKLRDLTRPDRGMLRMKGTRRYQRPLLPTGENKDCRDLNATIQCFTAGDERVNENVALTAVHTAFARLHNQYEQQLHQINPQWGGERLYQETRKIIGAVVQHIVYGEFLPILLGTQHMQTYGLTLARTGYANTYDVGVSPDITNVFGAAAFRYAHSQIQDVLHFTDAQYQDSDDKELSTMLRRPLEIYKSNHPGGTGVDSLILGVVSQPAQRVDRFFTKQITRHLFAENPPKGLGMDLPSINIQRAREHGIPSYNEWRDWCGLRRASSFDDLIDLPEDVRVKFSQLYDDVDDIDLYPAGVSEFHALGGVVGPTFACIISRQFRNLKTGDRFWYERRDPVTGFTPDQLKEIRKMTLARVICDTTDSIQRVQKYVMLQPISEAFKKIGVNNYQEAYSLASLYRGENNERRPCYELDDIDLTKWAQ